MTESKTELLTWLNDLLQVHYVKVEQCGTGAAYCQIFDSIYGDIPLGRVKFASKNDYDHTSNYKILQSGFVAHGVEKIVPIQKLIKCRYTDNLEFLQWMKKYWDAFYPGGGYDAVARRTAAREKAKEMATKAKPIVISQTAASKAKEAQKRMADDDISWSPRPRSRQIPAPKAKGAGGSVNSSRPTSAKPTIDIPLLPSVLTGTQPSPSNADDAKRIAALETQVGDLKLVADTLERERNFYYLKLRDLEVVVLEKMEKCEQSLAPFLSDIQTILYSTEEGFQSPRRKNLEPEPVLSVASASQSTTASAPGPVAKLVAKEEPSVAESTMVVTLQDAPRFDRPSTRPTSAKPAAVSSQPASESPRASLTTKTRPGTAKAVERPASAASKTDIVAATRSRPASAKPVGRSSEARAATANHSTRSSVADKPATRSQSAAADNSASRPQSAAASAVKKVATRPGSAANVVVPQEKTVVRPEVVTAERPVTRPQSAAEEKAATRPQSAKVEKVASRPETPSAEIVAEIVSAVVSRPQTPTASATQQQDPAVRSPSFERVASFTAAGTEATQSKPASRPTSPKHAESLSKVQSLLGIEQKSSSTASVAETQSGLKTDSSLVNAPTSRPASRPMSAKQVPADGEKTLSRPLSAASLMHDSSKTVSRPTSASEVPKEQYSARNSTSKVAKDLSETPEQRPLSRQPDEKLDSKPASRPLSAKAAPQEETKSASRPMSAKVSKPSTRPGSPLKNYEDNASTAESSELVKEPSDVDKLPLLPALPVQPAIEMF